MTLVVTWFKREFRKLFRYAGVSVISTITSLSILGLLIGVLNVSAGRANVVATTIATIPSFELNRRWVWSRTDRRQFFRQALPFGALSLTGLLLSTINVHLVAVWTLHAGWGTLARTAADGVANVGTFGFLWVFQFFLCDQVLFKGSRTQEKVLFKGPGSTEDQALVEHSHMVAELAELDQERNESDAGPRSLTAP